MNIFWSILELYLAFCFGVTAIHIWTAIGEEREYPFKRTILCCLLGVFMTPVMLFVYTIYRICGAIKKRWD